MSAAHRDMAKSQGSLAVALSDWIEEAYDLPKCSIPDLREYASSPEEAATILRQTWGIGEASVGNVVHLLELHGVRVFSLAVDSMNVDAFSMWKGSNIPIVMLNTLKSAERSRFDAAHELGHLCLHQHGSKNLNPSIEAQADSFASAFLMPRNSVLANAPAFPTIDRLISLKSRWGVSLAALVYRLRKLNIISEWQYKSLCVQIGKMGYRRAEPQSAERETSGVLQAILRDFHINKSGSRQKIAEALLLPLDEVDALLFGLTYGVTHGKRIGEPKGKAELQLVSSIAP